MALRLPRISQVRSSKSKADLIRSLRSAQEGFYRKRKGTAIISNTASPVVHPLNTLKGIANFASSPYSEDSPIYQGANELAREYKDSPSEAIGTGVGMIGGSLLGGKAMGMAGEGIAKGMGNAISHEPPILTR